LRWTQRYHIHTKYYGFASVGSETVMLALQRQRFMKFASEIASSDMIHIPSFIQTGLGIQKLLQGDTHRDTQVTDSKVIS
jgi:hypothetical protein